MEEDRAKTLNLRANPYDFKFQEDIENPCQA